MSLQGYACEYGATNQAFLPGFSGQPQGYSMPTGSMGSMSPTQGFLPQGFSGQGCQGMQGNFMGSPQGQFMPTPNGNSYMGSPNCQFMPTPTGNNFMGSPNGQFMPTPTGSSMGSPEGQFMAAPFAAQPHLQTTAPAEVSEKVLSWLSEKALETLGEVLAGEESDCESEPEDCAFAPLLAQLHLENVSEVAQAVLQAHAGAGMEQLACALCERVGEEPDSARPGRSSWRARCASGWVRSR